MVASLTGSARKIIDSKVSAGMGYVSSRQRVSSFTFFCFTTFRFSLCEKKMCEKKISQAEPRGAGYQQRWVFEHYGYIAVVSGTNGGVFFAHRPADCAQKNTSVLVRF